MQTEEILDPPLLSPCPSSGVLYRGRVSVGVRVAAVNRSRRGNTELGLSSQFLTSATFPRDYGTTKDDDRPTSD